MTPLKLKNYQLLMVLAMLAFCQTVFGLSRMTVQKNYAVQDLQQKIQNLKSRQNISDDLKNRLLAIYNDTIDNLSDIQTQEQQSDHYKLAMASMPQEIKQLEKQIADIEFSYKNRKPEKLSIFPTDELEQRLIIEKTRLSDIDAELGRIEGQLAEQVNRPQLIREKMAEIKSRHQEQQILANKSSDNLLEKEAKQIQLDIRIQLLNVTLKTLERESISDPLRLQLLKNRTHLLNIQREAQLLYVNDIDSALLERRQQTIDKEQTELLAAEKAAEGKHPLIREATQKNIALNRKLQLLNQQMEFYLQQKTAIDSRYKQVEKDFQSAEQKINLAGLSPALGNLLREQRRNLPQGKDYQRFNETIQHEIAQASLENYRLDELGKTLFDVSASLNQILNQPEAATIEPGEKFQIRTELRILLNDQKELAFRLADLYQEYSRVLGDADFSLQQLLAASAKFSTYLDQRLLWVPSAPVINQDFIQDLFHSFAWFLTPNTWVDVSNSLVQSLSQHPYFLLIGGILLALHWRFLADLRSALSTLIAETKQMDSFPRVLYALYGLVLVISVSLSIPILIAWVGIVLRISPDNGHFARAFADGCLATAVSYAVIQFLYRLFKTGGVAETLLLWHSSTTQLLHQQIRWSRYFLLLCIFLTVTTASDIFAVNSYALGRLALIAMMLIIMRIFHQFLYPQQGLISAYYRSQAHWLKHAAYLVYILALVVPVIVIGFAVAGYYQSALELEQKLINTVRLLFVLSLIYTIIALGIANARRKLAEYDHSLLHNQIESGDTVAHSEIEARVDVSLVNQQAYRLLSTLTALGALLGTWLIWKDILPAFSIIDHIELWQHTQLLDGKEHSFPITLSNLIMAIIYATVTATLVLYFPVLVDLMATQRFAMTTGSRYALIQLFRYVILSIGFLSIANELGGTWSQVQWLVAALGVGLGFGLQEIFANMVSGIILLFERPIRVGDTVTVGHITGKVSRIQMRATHIIDLDRKELVVPNKTFITDQLINWTLSDTVTRIVVPVNVAYGTDFELVNRLLHEVIATTEGILNDPEPGVLFNGLGEGCLHFDIQVFVHDMNDRLAVIHTLHTGVYTTLKTNNIQMPYPQREVHIKSIANDIVINMAGKATQAL